ncbi:hypothetical protein HHK36_022189 [Tetracentron sinense]|uniref:Aminotransferase-like plant mobile domain-containing protein n=1 Tax=Tetracentron sinense TaxID=13715 RepID=A0A834YUG7_TETSI|nr:hypothetical protein HHK36_022189 [Tetracentron sinense]
MLGPRYEVCGAARGITVLMDTSNMVRPKRLKTGESSSARPKVDDDYVPPTEVEEQQRESSRVGVSYSGAGATSSRGRTQPSSDPRGVRCSWKLVLAFYQKASPFLRDALGRTLLGPFLTIPRIQSDRRLIVALCESWFRETNTFHFPYCELAITPLDFVMLTGILIVGEVIPPLSIISMDRATGLMGVSLETVAADSGWEAGKMWAHEYLDPFRSSLKIPDITSFPRSSRWSAPSSKVDSHLLEKAREELDRLTLRRVTLQPFSDFDDMIQLSCIGVRVHGSSCGLLIFWDLRVLSGRAGSSPERWGVSDSAYPSFGDDACIGP